MIDFKKVDGKDVGDIKMFALSTCGWCKKTKAFLSDHGIAYSYVDVDLLEGGEMDEAIEKQRELNPNGSFPTIWVNGEDVIVGYDVQELEKIAGE